MEVLTNDHPDVIRNGVRYRLTVHIDKKLRYIVLNGGLVMATTAKPGQRIFFTYEPGRLWFYLSDLDTNACPKLIRHAARTNQLRASGAGFIRTLHEMGYLLPGKTYTVTRSRKHVENQLWEINYKRIITDIQTVKKQKK
jgi:hypothetical protein